MNIKYVILFFLLVVAGCSKKTEENVVPGERVGPVSAKISETSLIEEVGEENIRRKQIPAGEGEFENGHVLYENSNDEMEILWSGQYEKPVTTVILRKKNSKWKTAEGITVGMTLEELEKINGKPVIFLGFDWDYGGYVMSFNGGVLEKYKGLLNIRIYYTQETDTESIDFNEYSQVIGDREIVSDNPVLKKMKIEIIEMRINLISGNGEDITGVVKAQNGLVLRSKPSTDGEKITAIPDGTTIKITSLDGPEDEIAGFKAKWIEVEYQGQSGWVYGAFVEYINQ
ncbi:MAG TPA: SH3 domain-containing protein [Spirochaetota bacterium]|nr:SH3 domain-containing protein [Spirochaetota bacterium]